MNISEEVLKQFAGHIANAKRLVVSTGAGISKESGVPTFRDAHDGLWAKYDPMQLATPQAFRRNPKLVWDWYQYRRDLIASAEPNPGHYALVELEELTPQMIIVTQNVDGFHQMVGSRDVIGLHGNIQEFKCFDNCQGIPTLIDIDALEWDKESGPPLCPYCQQAYARPNVVWFGEALPAEALERAFQLSLQADVMLVVGTSGLVQPSASLPAITRRSGGMVLEINPNPSMITSIANQHLMVPSGEALPVVVNLVRQMKET